MRNLRFVLTALAVLSIFCSLAQAENLSIGLMAGATTWNPYFKGLQTPGWDTSAHPVGLVDVQYKHLFGEVGGDPHRPGEASTVSVGLRGDLLHYERYALYGQASIGLLWAPSFLEYCGGYEYKHGDCGAGYRTPEECPWFSTNVGLGVRINLNKHIALEPVRVEYLGPYAVGPRLRFLAGLRLH